ncbi:MAG: magnesium/cobalt transporter CorA [Deltaproteobacteria bacterium]|nr:magnesium/cobalt transporter CorA [Deltaproteobacteria bacterium]
MIKILICSATGELTETEDLEQLSHAIQSQQKVWVDFEDPTNTDLNILETVFHFHPLTIEEAKQDVGAPKIDLYDGYAYLVLHRMFYHFETEECERREFDVFISNHFLITLHKSHLSRTFNHLRENIKLNAVESLAKDPSYVLYQLIDLAIKDHDPVIEEWQEMLEEIEHQVLKGTEENILDQILQFKKLVSTLRKNFIPEREVLKQLHEKNLPFISNEIKPYFKSLVDDMNLLLQELDELKEQAASVFETYAAMLTLKMTEASNKMNFVMQRLTIATTIFLPLTFIVGVYGMNFENMPEMHWKYSYYAVWGTMILLVIAMIFFFKKKKWI